MNSSISGTISNVVSVDGLVSIVISLICIWLSWWALQNLKLDLLIRNPQGAQGKLLQVLLSIVLGRFVAGFILDYLNWSQMLKYMF
ncbi:DUF1146 family protein [Paenibacillus crassostreae]|uniref:DUF1146 domain-containing protein n=1 Tax=Paenibacillus crassostreae TaxID=1763538 RepID=A0A167B381_9BACL|nr:DUF1146 family protein [Paenibacillus crassostreae]AOZ93210.1 hypothetical protein LPB68_13980 [Paenibacillus crassostreae]OAB71699.1 hypothetical protein PNBC_16910 [Paenibacillus crassostreae]